jgi:hypothetical protein
VVGELSRLRKDEGPDTAGAVAAPTIRDTGANLPSTVDSNQRLEDLAEEKSLAVVGRRCSPRPVYRIRQSDRKGIEGRSRVPGQTAFISMIGSDQRWGSRPRATSRQGNENDAASRGSR